MDIYERNSKPDILRSDCLLIPRGDMGRWDLASNDATDGDETEKLKLIAKQNIIVFALWSLYSADKKINNLNQTNQLTDESVDN